MRVTFRYHKTGREKVMSEREADVLTRLGHGALLTAAAGTYQTRDMKAGAPAPAPVQSEEETDDEEFDDLDDVTQARSITDTQEPSVTPRRRGRPPKDPK